MQQDEILKQHRRRCRTTPVVTGQVAPLPDCLECFRVQTGGPVAAKVNIDSARLNHRRRCGVAVGRIAQRARLLVVKNFLIVKNLAAVPVHADDEHLLPVSRSGRQPYLPPLNNG